MIIKDKKEHDTLKEAGRRLAFVLDEVAEKIAPGVTEKELDAEARRLIEKGGDTPAFLGYTPRGAEKPYPATLCVSVNDAVVHGIPTDRPFREGDVVALDIGLVHDGIVVDMAKTYLVGVVSDKIKKLVSVTEESLTAGIAASRAGGRIGDIGHAISSVVEGAGFEVVYELGGHGVGNKVHEGPFIPNYGKKGRGEKLVLGMVLALEPIVAAGEPDIVLADDGYTYKTKDGSIAAHFEHTILITEKGAEIVTRV